MFPFYAMFFIFVELSIENRANLKRAQRIIDKVVSSLQIISEGITQLHHFHHWKYFDGRIKFYK